MAATIAYSIIVPVYNGSQTVAQLIARITAVMQPLHRPFELIFVDDCSRDNSWQVLTKLKEEHPFIKLYQLQNNSGQHTATLCGALKANGETIITIDDDLQIQPEDIPQLIAKKQTTSAQLVYGHFKNKQQSSYKNIARTLLFLMLKRMLKDFTYASSFRVFDKALLQDIDTSYRKYYTLDVSLIMQKPQMAFVDVEHKPRAIGRSNYKFWSLIGFVASYFINFTRLPIQILLYSGILLAAGGFAGSVFSVLSRPNLFLASVVVCCTGLVMLSLALWAEYFARYMQAAGAKPLFVINQRAE